MLKLPQDMQSVNYTDDPEIIQLMMDIAPGAAAMALIQAPPLLSDLHSWAPMLDPMPDSVKEHNFVAYVCSKYSPMGKRFRCWHTVDDDVQHLDAAMTPFLLLALVCPSFDFVAVEDCTQEVYASQLERAIDMATYRKHAPRLRRFLPHRLE
ncbi:hypothetical protein GGI19_001298 [Coemansia pectinata]|uniref:Uncharacterized protein n=1 Tax=Coemansia pectinata TaxID=1052879 RepID=A0A9W8LBE6_9FUNG|nr:hypothetical protein GGI19_001298 [Coemansia pectinata]